VTRVRTDLHALFCCAFFATLGQPARAEPTRASLIVTRDDGSRECPDSSTLTARVETVAGKPLFDAAAAEPRDTWLQVEFVRSIHGLHAVISARGGRQGTRTLDDVGPGCASLADAVAITLAILLDPATAGVSDPPPLALPTAVTTPVVTTSALASPPVDAQPSPASAPGSRETDATVVGIDASAGPTFAMLEGVVPFVEAGVRARFGSVFALGGGGGFLFPAHIDFGDGSVDVSLSYGYARACANLLPKGRTRIEGCLEPMVGGLRGSGKGYDQGNHAEWVLWSAAAALVQAYGPITKSVLWSIRGRVLTPLARHGFSVDEGGSPEQAFKLSAVGGSFAFGIEAEL
jgi:hypothetical protein